MTILIHPVAVLHTGEITIQMAPYEYVPYSVYYFLELVKHFEVLGSLHGMGLKCLLQSLSHDGIAFCCFDPSFEHMLPVCVLTTQQCIS